MAIVNLTTQEWEDITADVAHMTENQICDELDVRLDKIKSAGGVIDVDEKINNMEFLVYLRGIEAEQVKNVDALKDVSIHIDPENDTAVIDYSMQPPQFQRIRRITGYLVGTLDRFNNAKRHEEHDRLKHTDKDGQSFLR